MGRWPRYRKRLATTGEKVRNVLVLIYIEDLEAAGATYWDLLAYVAALHIEACVSPVHDHDTFTGEDVRRWCEQHIDPDTGDLDVNYLHDAPYVGKPKKPHVHLLFKSSNQHDAFWWSDLMSGLLDIRPTMWDKCLSVNGSIRYFAHLDDPDKYLYSPFDIHGFAGIDMSALVKVDDKTRTELFNVAYDMINIHGCNYFFEMIDAAQSTGDAELVAYIRGTHSVWCQYLGSKAQKSRDDAFKRKLKEQAEKAYRRSENVEN